MQAALDRGRPDWQWEPTLIEIEDDAVRVSTGLAPRTRLVSLVGPRRAWRIAQLVATAQVPIVAAAQSRRGIMRQGAALSAAIVGLALLGPTPQSTNALQSRLETQGKKNPGRYSRREGIRSWRVRKTSTGYTVTFTHRNRRLSGVVAINRPGTRETMTFSLTRDNKRLSMALNRRRGTFAGVDAKGRATSGVFDERRNRWDIRSSSQRVLNDSERDFRIGFAVYTDLSPKPRRTRFKPRGGELVSLDRTHEVDGTLAAEADCPCSPGSHRKYGRNVNSGRTLACFGATLDVNQQCTNGWCIGCCRLYGGDDCDCACLFQDVGCVCHKAGDPCTGSCYE